MKIFSGIMGWLAVGMFVGLIVMLIISLLAKKYENLAKVNRVVNTAYIPVGIGLIVTALIHGLTAGVNFFSFTAGGIGFWLVVVFVLSIWFTFTFPTISKIIPILLAGVGLGVSIWHLVEVGGSHLFDDMQDSMSGNNSSTQTGTHTGTNSSTGTGSNTQSSSQIMYKDGTYEGSGTGLKGQITVEVKVENGIITTITVKESSETASYMAKAKEYIDNQLLNKHSAEQVDAAAGATYASNGYIQAIKAALEKGKK